MSRKLVVDKEAVEDAEAEARYYFKRAGAFVANRFAAEIETSFPALKPHLRDNDGKVRRFINFYVNEEDIRFLGNDEYAFKDGDEVLVIPSIAGGAF